MATALNVASLTLNAKENPEFARFIIEGIFDRPELKAIHTVYTGLTMQEQIVFASQFGKVGLKGNGACTRQTTGAQTVLTQLYWLPVIHEDTIIHCQAEVNGLFKAYYDKIASYRERFEIEGSDEEIFLAILLQEAINKLITRSAWFGDTAVAEATAGAAGLIAAGNVKFYDYLTGLWKQIFTYVTATTMKRFAIAENAEVTPELQLTLAEGRSVEIFEGMWKKADARLRNHPDAQIMVSGAIFENYRQYLQSKSVAFELNTIQNGFQMLKWNGKNIVNMETVWDIDLQADFVDNTTNNAYWLPNRALLTVPANIPIGTLNENDFTELEVWYNRDERTLKMAFGFTLDAKLLEKYMAVAAY